MSKMAAGVSIVVCLLLQITCFSTLLDGTETFEAVYPRYDVTSSYGHGARTGVYDVAVAPWGEHAGVRMRREVNASDTDPQLLPDDGATVNQSVTASQTDDDAQEAEPSTHQPAEVVTHESARATTTQAGQPAEAGVEPQTTQAAAAETTLQPVERNYTEREDDNHDYYSSTVLHGEKAAEYWTTHDQRQTHDTLSHSHRTAATKKLNFKFLFYGHEVEQITIATGGFLYTSEFVHQWLTATQYVAPLMANFDSRLGNESWIYYLDNGTALTVWWEGIHLQDHEKDGTFSFMASIHMDGTIIFSYRHVPLAITGITTRNHPVKVGLSDAYYIDQPVDPKTGQPYTRRTIYEYHRVSIPTTAIATNTTIIIRPNPTCIQQTNCTQCVDSSEEIGFHCRWCNKLNRCSDGFDRMRQEWLKHSCGKTELKSDNQCRQKEKEVPVVGIIAIIILVTLLVLLVGWLIYAYMYPQSKSGMWLIEHRPSQLKAKLNNVKFWKRGDGDKYMVSMQPDGESVA